MVKEEIKSQILALAKGYADCLAAENAQKAKKYICIFY